MSEVAIHQMTEHEARKLTERIRIAAVNFTDAKDKLMRLVQEAKDGGAHLALGVASWTAYLAEVLGDEPMRLARDERQEMVQLLSAEGMSTRAIAPIVGANRKTVMKDIREVVQSGPPATTLTDTPGQVQKLTGANSASTVTGLDGKTYKRPEATSNTPRAESITSQFTGVIVDLNKVMARLHRISENQNFTKNKNQIATLHGSDLARTISELTILADSLK